MMSLGSRLSALGSRQARYKIGIFLVSSFVLVVSFQNCTPSGFQQSSGDSTLSSLGKTGIPLYAKAPFAYDVEVNQITYMSCVQQDLYQGLNSSVSGDPKFFTFKVGAFDNRHIYYDRPTNLSGNMVGSTQFYGCSSGAGPCVMGLKLISSSSGGTATAVASGSNAVVGGVRLSDAFYQYADANLTPPYGSVPKNQATVDQLIDLLQNSPINSSVRLQLSLRSVPSNTTTIAGFATDLFGDANSTQFFNHGFLAPLDSDDFSQFITRTRGLDSSGQPVRLRNFPVATSALPTVVDTKISVNSDAYMAAMIRTNLMGGTYVNSNTSYDGGLANNRAGEPAKYLTIGFTQNATGPLSSVQGALLVQPPQYTVTPLSMNTSTTDSSGKTVYKTPDGVTVTPNANVAYGRGFRLNFTKPNPDGKNGFSQVITASDGNVSLNLAMQSVTEYDLLNVSSPLQKNWVCDSRLHYVIVDPGDADAFCPPINYSDLSEQERIDLAIMRRHLPATEWKINSRYQCVVPTGSASCYSRFPSAPAYKYQIMYRPIAGKACGYSRLNGSTSNPTPISNNPYYECPHFVSVCLK